MAVLNGYLTLTQLQAAVGDSTFEHEAEYERAIEAASRQIDLWTGRHFWQTPASVQRLFRATDRTSVCASAADGPVDFATADTTIVETDDDGDGEFETPWDVSQWQPEPFNPVNGWPYTRITTTTRSREFPLDGRRPRVRVTTSWGWATPPGDAEQACEYLSTLYYRAKDQYGASTGVGSETEELTADPIKIAMKLMEPYAVPGGTLYKPPSC